MGQPQGRPKSKSFIPVSWLTFPDSRDNKGQNSIVGVLSTNSKARNKLESTLNLKSLFEKYDTQAPRYTSYPTVPFWSHSPTTEQWVEVLNHTMDKPDVSWSLYVHIPFCETLCTFCGCHKTITKNHSLEKPYIEDVIRELRIYESRIPGFNQKPLSVLHLGGGSPTFLSANHLKFLVEELLNAKVLHPNFEGSVEVDPRRLQKQQLEVLRSQGFTRVSLGVQDFNLEVQKLVNRIQPFDLTKSVFNWSRDLGYKSINLDLIYGLPGQTLKGIEFTIKKTIELKPDRIALYSFALTPWLKPQQRSFRDDDLPSGKTKRDIYEKAREILISEGYEEIGMDHFALKSDALSQAAQFKRLHRNFMGYTDIKTDVLLGIGVSSLSEVPTCFHQNMKNLSQYKESVAQETIPTLKGHILSLEDQVQRKKILQLMTEGCVDLEPNQTENIRTYLKEMLFDKLVEIDDTKLSITKLGKPFLRNACMALDLKMREKIMSEKVFSQSV